MATTNSADLTPEDTKVCAGCRSRQTVSNFGKARQGLRSRCKACRSIEGAADYRRDPEAHWARNLKSRYNITSDRYWEMLAEQDGGCAVCGSSPDSSKGGRFHVDHDHSCCPGRKSCGKCIRGLLCQRCNLALGHIENVVLRNQLIGYLVSGGY